MRPSVPDGHLVQVSLKSPALAFPGGDFVVGDQAPWQRRLTDARASHLHVAHGNTIFAECSSCILKNFICFARALDVFCILIGAED